MNATNSMGWAVSPGGKGHGRSVKHQVLSKQTTLQPGRPFSLDTHSFPVFLDHAPHLHHLVSLFLLPHSLATWLFSQSSPLFP